MSVNTTMKANIKNKALVDSYVDDMITNLKDFIPTFNEHEFIEGVEEGLRDILSGFIWGSVEMKAQHKINHPNFGQRNLEEYPITNLINETMINFIHAFPTQLNIENELKIRWRLLDMFGHIDDDEFESTATEGNGSAPETQTCRQYSATYTRKTTGNVGIDANSISRETVSAPSLEELKAMLEILAIGEKGFSVISVERSE